MKFTLSLLLLLAAFAASGQKNELISEEMSGHIYKPKKVDATDKRIQNLQLPPGFSISKFAEGLGKPRIIAVAPNGDVYVSRREKGDVLLLKDTDKDGKADKTSTVIKKKNAHGLAIYKDHLYLVTIHDLYRARIRNDGSLGDLQRLLDSLPDGGQHPNRTIAFGPDSMLYITIGSTCNACEETREESATIARARPDGSELKIFAKGLRNTIGFDWHPQTNQLYGMDHGIDWLGNDEPMEELNLLEEGNDYGWPYIFGKGKYNKSDEPKEMSWEEYAEKATDPVLEYTAHSAPMGLLFYTGNMFPEEYRNNAFITLHGSWNRKPATGYKIILAKFRDGKPVSFEDFLTGFLSADNTTHFGRPVGMTQHPDGSLLFTDDSNGIVYRVSYGESR